jgi:hypothetical protein
MERCREPAYRLGFALHLGRVRFLGTFLAYPTEVPLAAIAHVAAQLRALIPAIFGMRDQASPHGTCGACLGAIPTGMGSRVAGAERER